MSRIIVLTCVLLTSLILLGQFTGCGQDEYREVSLDLYSLILPGATDTLHEAIAKFTWQGGG
jgi:hypothetical protein